MNGPNSEVVAQARGYLVAYLHAKDEVELASDFETGTTCDGCVAALDAIEDAYPELRWRILPLRQWCEYLVTVYLKCPECGGRLQPALDPGGEILFCFGCAEFDPKTRAYNGVRSVSRTELNYRCHAEAP